ncbi:MAG TPA: hypothetical protein DC058_08070 [Planctomycetaceae bacterium]|nr:hypothetical protein [Planctomycetaceae bacterium]
MSETGVDLDPGFPARFAEVCCVLNFYFLKSSVVCVRGRGTNGHDVVQQRNRAPDTADLCFDAVLCAGWRQ